MLVSDAIPRAYREASIKQIGASLTTNETTEGLQRLNDFLFSLFSGEIGENLTDFPYPANIRNTALPADPIALDYPDNLTSFDQPYSPLTATYTATSTTVPANSRILWRGTGAATIYLPEQPSDGARIGFADVGSTATLTINGNGRAIEGATTKVLTTASAAREWFYRGDLGQWIVLAQLTISDSTPLPPEFDALIISGTAIRLTALDDIKPTAGTTFIYDRLIKRAKARYRQHANTSYGGQNLRGADLGVSGYRENPSW